MAEPEADNALSASGLQEDLVQLNTATTPTMLAPRQASASECPEAARSNAAPQSLLFAQAPVCLFELELDGGTAVIRAANARAAAFYDRAAVTLCGQSLHTLYEPHAAIAHEHLLARASAAGAASLDTVHINGRGERLAVRLHAQRRDPAGGPWLILAAEDISPELERRTLLEAIDEDRRRIAHELHDTVAQNLAAIRMAVGLWKEQLHEQPDQVAEEMNELLVELQGEIDRTREAIFALRPVELDRLGFGQSLRCQVAAAARQYGFAAELVGADPAPVLPAELELPLLRIVQEALNNSGRHARATQVRVALELADGGLRLRVEDNGSGCPLEPGGPSVRPGHYGLLQMRERVYSIGGEIAIDSAPGRGTRIEVRLAPRGY